MPTAYQQSDYAPNELNPSSFGNFNFTGNWIPTEGGYRGRDATGDFWYTPFQNRTQGFGAMDNPTGRWNQDGQWVTDTASRSSFGQYVTEGAGPDGRTGTWFAGYGPNSQLVNLTGNTNLPGLNSANNLGWGRMSRTAPIAQWNEPAHSDFDLIADFVMPVVGSAIVGGAGAGLWGAGAASGAGAGAGAAGASSLEAALAGYAGTAAGTGIGAFGAAGAGAGGLAAAEAALGELGINTAAMSQAELASFAELFSGADAAWGANGFNYDPTFGIDPASTQFSGGTMTNAEIAAQIGQNPSFLEQLQNLVTNTPGSMPTGAGVGSGNTTGGNSVMNQLSNLFTGNAPLGQYGSILSSILGMIGSNSQTNALQGLAAQQGTNQNMLLNMGAPYRSRLAQLYANPNAFLSSPEVQIPVQQGTDILARALSTQGNPALSGGPLQQLQSYASNQLFGRLGQERDRLAGFGGLTAYNNAGASGVNNYQLPLLAAQSENNIWNAAGAGLNSALNPQPTWQQLLAMLQGQTSPGLSGGGLTNAQIAEQSGFGGWVV